MSTKLNLIITTAILALLLALTAIGSFDYTVSVAMVSPGSFVGEAGNLFGEQPAYWAMLLSILILFACRNRNVLWQDGLAHLLALPFMAFFSYAIAFAPVHYIYEFAEGGVPQTAMMVVYAVAMSIFTICLYLGYKKTSQWFFDHRRHACVIISLIVLEIIIVNVLKVTWGRPRMRSIETIEQFRYWYQVAGPAVSEEFKSFPSGHTANAFVAIAFSLFIAPQKKRLILWVTTIALTWGVFVAISRILLGAHFFSDVIVGGYVTVILFYLLKSLFFKNEA